MNVTQMIDGHACGWADLPALVARLDPALVARGRVALLASAWDLDGPPTLGQLVAAALAIEARAGGLAEPVVLTHAALAALLGMPRSPVRNPSPSLVSREATPLPLRGEEGKLATTLSGIDRSEAVSVPAPRRRRRTRAVVSERSAAIERVRAMVRAIPPRGVLDVEDVMPGAMAHDVQNCLHPMRAEAGGPWSLRTIGGRRLIMRRADALAYDRGEWSPTSPPEGGDTDERVDGAPSRQERRA